MKRYKPLVGKLFWIAAVLLALLLAGATVLAAASPLALAILIVIDFLCVYLAISPLFGYVELREDCVFIKFGLMLERRIEYERIRGVELEWAIYADSMLSLKNAAWHVNIKYDRFNLVCVSVVGNDELIREIENRCGIIAHNGKSETLG